MANIPFIILIICMIMTIVALVFYKIRHLSVILAALLSPSTAQAYVFPKPCPVLLEYTTVEDLLVTSAIISTLSTAIPQ